MNCAVAGMIRHATLKNIMKTESIQRPTIADLAAALTAAKRHIDDDMIRDDDSLPSIDVTLACDERGFALQLGDNSYSGGAYFYKHWGVATLYRRTNCRELAKDLIEQCLDLAAY
jgi:hypothetical protein